MTIKQCPVCDGHIYPHCNPNPKGKYHSPTCDLVRCNRCQNVGTLDGRYWPERPYRRNSLLFREILDAIIALRTDLDESEAG